MGQPVCFDKAPFIREGGSTVRLQPGSAKEARLWERLQAGDFELKVAERDVEFDELPSKLDIDAYFGLLGLRRPTALEGALPFLEEQDLIRKQDNGGYSILNLGALLVEEQELGACGLAAPDAPV